MIAIAKSSRTSASAPRWHQRFLEMLPTIRRHAQFCFRGLPPLTQEELVQATIVHSFVALRQLAHRRKLAAAYPTSLARFAVAQVRQGRQVGGHLNANDVLAPYCHRKRQIQIERLDHRDGPQGEWHAAMIADRRMPVAELVAFRVDFAAWLVQLAPRQRQIALFLVVGNSTSDTACQFRLSHGRISQLRRDFHRDWLQFHGEEPSSARHAVAA